MKPTGTEELLTRLLGERLATKLIEDAAQANTELAKGVSKLIADTITNRTALLRDELAERKYDPARDEAMALLSSVLAGQIICSLQSYACLIGVQIDIPLSKYIGHAAEHYEVEQIKRQAEAATALVDRLQDNNVHQQAKAHSANN